MLIDLAINPFDAEVPAMIELARAAEELGFSSVWVADHFSGAMIGRQWSRDPFVCLAAIAASTRRIDVGVLVANMMNRHPAQLASAVNSLQSLAAGRVRLGLGSGAVPGSRFAAEHESIGRVLLDANGRREMLVDQLKVIRSSWADNASGGVVDGSAPPHLIVGASSWPTIRVALDHADGVNIRRTRLLGKQLRQLRDVRPPGFEVSVLDDIDSIAAERRNERNSADPSGDSEVAAVDWTGVDRLIVGISPPHHRERLVALNNLLESHHEVSLTNDGSSGSLD